uniref:RNA polymerase sigma factor n=1 Tax=uncultured bacterium CSLF42 TaxID=1091574 RepID=G4WVX9_9BACT|nr:RNA polymerase sigma factor RpoS [uncultured bacterium CSLF42]
MVESLDAVSLYFRAIKDFPELSREAFNTLWHRARKGDKAAKKELVERNLRLVIPIAKKYYRPGLDFLDIIEEGNLGLMHAIDKFDPKKGFRFSTYGAYWIEQSIRRAIDEQSKTIRIPPHAWEALRRWLRQWDLLHGQLGRDPTLQEMAQKLHLSARQVKGILDAAEAARGIGSLEAPLDEDENLTIKDVISDDELYAPDRLISLFKLHDELDVALSQLPLRERQILEMRFGLNGENQTLEEVGKKLKVSRERIRQLEKRGLERLRRLAQRMGIV